MNNVVREKSKRFAIQIVHAYQKLCAESHEFVLSKQLLRSGTSIGANIAEASCAFSRKEFLSKMYIAFKECSETEYWLELLHETGYLSSEDYQNLVGPCGELKALLSSITKTIRASLTANNS